MTQYPEEKKEEAVMLPLTSQELDEFVAEISKTYDLPESDDTYESICTLIMHMPQHCCKAPLSFFGESVLKSMANKAAYVKLEEFRDKRKAQRDAAEAKLTTPDEPIIEQPLSN